MLERKRTGCARQIQPLQHPIGPIRVTSAENAVALAIQHQAGLESALVVENKMQQTYAALLFIVLAVASCTTEPSGGANPAGSGGGAADFGIAYDAIPTCGDSVVMARFSSCR